MADHAKSDGSLWLGWVLSHLAITSLVITFFRFALGYQAIPITQLLGFVLVTASIVVGYLAVHTKSQSLAPSRVAFSSAVLALPILLPWGLSRFLSSTYVSLICITLLFSLLVAGLWYLRPFRTSRTGLILGTLSGSIVSIWLVTGRVHTPLTLEFAHLGIQYHDTMYHAAISQMLGYFDTRSSGVMALSPVPYHVLSHKIIFGLSHMTGAPVLQGYMLFVYLVGAPLMLFLLMQAGLSVTRHFGTDRFALPFVLGAFALLAIFDIRSFLTSESYLVGLLFFFLALSVATDLVTAKHVRPPILLIHVAVFACLIWLASLSKISVGAVLAPIAITAVVLADQFRLRSLLLAPPMFSVIVFIVLQQQKLGAGVNAQIFDFFHYTDEYSRLANPQWIFLIFTLFAALRVRMQIIAQLRLILVLFAGVAAGLVAANLLRLDGGSAYYFAGPATWCTVFIMAGCLQAGAVASRRWQLGLAAILTLAFTLNVADDMSGLENDLARLEEAKAAQSDPPTLYTLSQHVATLAPNRPPHTAVYIAGTAQSYWQLPNLEKRRNPCWILGFFVPAITGLPSLNGLPPIESDCDLTINYGLDTQIDARAAAVLPNDAAICTLAARHAISTVLAFETMADGRVVNCH